MEVIRSGTSTFLENSIVKTKPTKPKHDPGLKEKATTVQKKKKDLCPFKVIRGFVIQNLLLVSQVTTNAVALNSTDLCS